jgi:hypothetical protein
VNAPSFRGLVGFSLNRSGATPDGVEGVSHSGYYRSDIGTSPVRRPGVSGRAEQIPNFKLA